MTGYSTSWLDLRPEVDTLRKALDGKWRNQLRRAEEAKLAIDQAHGGKHVAWLLAKEGTQARARGYLGLGAALIQDIVAASGATRCSASRPSSGPSRSPACCSCATARARPTSRVERRSRPRAPCPQSAAVARRLELKRRGVAWLDLGGIETTHGEGIAHFKLGLAAP